MLFWKTSLCVACVMASTSIIHSTALTVLKFSPAAHAAEATAADSCLLSVLPTERFYSGVTCFTCLYETNSMEHILQ